MRALRLTGWKTMAELVDVPDPEPGPGQVVVRVGGAGVCRSDLHLMREFDIGMLPWNPPFTLGHENAGWVHAVGEGVSGVEVGQAVAVHSTWGCGTCARCLLGAENYCENPVGAPIPRGGCGLGLDGGMAEFLLVPHARHLVPLPDGLDPVTAAPLTDAGLTPYHAVRRSWPKLVPGSTAVVIGIGGLGHLAVQIIKATTAARVIAVSRRPDALKLAERCGADLVLSAGERAAAEIRDATGGRGADVVIDCVGSETTLAIGMAASRAVGDLTIVGCDGGTVPVSFFSLPFELSVQTTYIGSRTDLVEVIDLASRGQLYAEVTTFPLAQALEAYRLLESGDVVGRAVIVPAST